MSHDDPVTDLGHNIIFHSPVDTEPTRVNIAGTPKTFDNVVTTGEMLSTHWPTAFWNTTGEARECPIIADQVSGLSADFTKFERIQQQVDGLWP